jgi:hypothetical protein
VAGITVTCLMMAPYRLVSDGVITVPRWYLSRLRRQLHHCAVRAQQ